MIFYLYIPCPGSSGTSFTSNTNSSTNLSGEYITFPSLFPGECYSISLIGVFPTPINPTPTPDVTINWGTEVYTLFNSCTDCIDSQEVNPPCLCSTATNLTNQSITFQYINCEDKSNNYPLLQPGQTGPKVCVREWLGTWPKDTFEYFGDCIDNECPPYYILTDCTDSENSFCTNTDLSAYADNLSSVILVGEAYAGKCWTVTTTTECVNPVSVTVQYYYKNCENCVEQFVVNYQLINCNEDGVIIYTSTDLSEYAGSVITLEAYEGQCWYVQVYSGNIPGNIPVTVVSSYQSCVDCTTPQYLLEDCDLTDPDPDIITNTDLSAYVGDVVTLLNCPDKCWIVSEVTENITTPQLVHVTANHADCEACIPTPPEPVRPTFTYKSVTPGYDTPGCEPDKFERIVCNFSEAMYRQIMVDAYGITPCCGEEDIKYEIKYELIKLKAIADPDYDCYKSPDCGCSTSTYGLTPCTPNDNPTATCYNYLINIATLTGTTFTYRDCSNEEQTIIVPASNTTSQYTVCGIANQVIATPTNIILFNYTELALECTD
jgi:hypothetical protein